ncbi:DUF58 domain-containing protein [Neorhodopirellula lusitana]|uniref:DUF58 domain-containing protein n=1 Tax=Neorhodopirellula lusitana TaxID=445327 RepID=UPI00384B01CC
MDRRNTRHRLTRLGIQVMLIGAFGVLGGSLNGLNLLVVVAALVLATLVAQWRVSRCIISSMRIDRRMPGEAFAGKPIRIRYQVQNEHRLMPMWMVRIEDGIERMETAPDDGLRSGSFTGRFRRKIVTSTTRSSKSQTANSASDGGPSSKLAPKPVNRESPFLSASTGVGLLVAGQATSTYFDVVAQHRGRYRLGRWRASTLSPFALSTAYRESIWEEDTIDVYPRLLRLQRSWHRLLPSRVGNVSATAQRQGPADDVFFGLREYRHGDSPRYIHWRTTARLGEPAVRQFEQQRRYDLCLLVDAWVESDVRSDSSEELHAMAERAISLAASVIVDLAHGNQSQVLLVVAGRDFKIVSGNASPLGLRRMLQSLARVEVGSSVAVSDAMLEASGVAKRLPDMLVVSSRSQTRAIASDAATGLAIKRWKSRSQLQWVDVSSDDFRRWAVADLAPEPMSNATLNAIESDVASSSQKRKAHQIEIASDAVGASV